ncbi:GNAT family N-acetyltransferase [Octadecabacter sp. G9-8]|uniref:GNAT family N-acetyltransferase n=1 Tax=Octadecabacter dasysiphoniae TaxID=2909341 RepID=A0ABS9CWJ3_9RHOB|nr:GNAT family N-acetyltransferase [Octadecabacter dasysiphoniae]MCF2871632.1 GNAT family N-acetyltransferase [Octadecabacter dasysiphoniae]
MQVERIPEWALTQADDTNIATLLERGFQEDFGNRSFHQQRHHVRFVVRDNGSIIGHMALCYRAVRLGDTLTTICGLAEVVTAPEARGKGVASALLTDAISFAKSTPATYFLLFGDRPMYAGFGFENHPNTKTYVVLDDARTASVEARGNRGVMVLPLTETPWDPEAHLDLLGHKF